MPVVSPRIRQCPDGTNTAIRLRSRCPHRWDAVVCAAPPRVVDERATLTAVLRRRNISTLSPGAGSDAVVPLRMGFMRRDLGVDKLLIGRLDAG